MEPQVTQGAENKKHDTLAKKANGVSESVVVGALHAVAAPLRGMWVRPICKGWIHACIEPIN